MNPEVLQIIAQMLLKGRVHKEELYQLSSYIPGINDLLASFMKIDAQQLFEKTDKGEVITNDIIIPLLGIIYKKIKGL
ncbi:tape measure protein [Flavobacterium sp. CBA20B-1]|uniref:tape measure protein n=1 Tax=unclassified Flavobacterium TaxID=196869 RepID=UPI002224DE7D|nr:MULTISPECIES: tape measure protein [unclassified Flavobacterium]WCM42404.1 tape measure protein [Flavobacterium sp. CBA20B-1]